MIEIKFVEKCSERNLMKDLLNEILILIHQAVVVTLSQALVVVTLNQALVVVTPNQALRTKIQRILIIFKLMVEFLILSKSTLLLKAVSNDRFPFVHIYILISLLIKAS